MAKTYEQLEKDYSKARADLMRLYQRIGTLFETLRHGDESHQAWLRAAIAAHFVEDREVIRQLQDAELLRSAPVGFTPRGVKRKSPKK